MMYSEFCKLLGNEYTISMDEYKMIEYVYTWSPLIKNYGGKEQIVEMYKCYGIELIKQLIPACKLVETREKVLERCKKAHETCDKYQKIATMLDEIKENSDIYWQKASELADEQADCIEDIDKIDKEFEID